MRPVSQAAREATVIISTETRTTTICCASPADATTVRNLVRLLGRRRRSVALGLLVSAPFVAVLDTSIRQHGASLHPDLGLSHTGVTWVVDA